MNEVCITRVTGLVVLGIATLAIGEVGDSQAMMMW